MLTPAQAELQELFLASQNLPNASCEVGRIQLSLTDLGRIARSRTSSKQADAKAHYLLAGSGFNAEQIVGEIAGLEFEMQHVAPATGVERYLTNKKQDSVYQSINKLVAAATNEFDQKLGTTMSMDWSAAQKRQIFELLGHEKPPKVIRTARLGRTLLGELPATSARVNTLHKAKDFGTVISKALDRGTLLAEGLSEVANRWDAVTQPQLVDSWIVVSALVKDRKFHQAKPAIKDLLLKGRQSLEFQYRQYIEEEINLRRRDAQLGGVPSSFNKIRAFVDLKYKNSSEIEHINKTPIWAQIYFLVRCGFIEEAGKLVKDRKDIFDYIETNFATYFTAWTSGNGLTPAYQQLISSDYAALFRPGTVFDPFKQALYKIIGRCDLTHKSIPAATTTEDWLWLQIYLTRNGSEYSPADLQQFISKAGAANFDPSGTNPAKYFNLLILVGLYEQAVDFLIESDEISAVHFAICLNYYGLLNISNEAPQKEGKLLVYENHIAKFNFSLAIARYTRLFRQQNSKSAVDYLCIIAQNRDYDPVYQRWAIACLQELAIESRLYIELFGDALTMKQGHIEIRLSIIGIDSRHDYLDQLVLAAAETVYHDGRITDAIILYHIGEDYNKVIAMTNSLVSQTLASTPLGQTIGRGEVVGSELFNSDHPVDLAHSLIQLQEKHPLLLQTISVNERRTTQTLLAVAAAMNALAHNEYQRCFGLIESTGLVYTDAQSDFAKTRELATNFSQYSSSLTQIFPHLLEMVLLCCINIVKGLKGTNSVLVDQYLVRAGNCIAFVGLIQYHMPSQVYSRLTQLESELSSL